MSQRIEKLDPNFAATAVEDAVQWYDARKLGVQGQGWPETSEAFCRLPDKAKGVVRDAVWELSRHSAGLYVDFMTDADTISARWSLRFEALAMNHMPATGVSGLDLYARDDNGRWRWAGVARPAEFPANETVLATDIAGGSREYRMYLPLYNGTTALEIGVPKGAAIRAVEYSGTRKPIVYYGTSITHGGCAARPGMAYPSIIGRWLDWPGINLGFSGNGQAEPEVAQLLAELDAEIFVVDCIPNLSEPLVRERVGPLVETIRAAHPDLPILMVENVVYQRAWLQSPAAQAHDFKNAALREIYERLTGGGMTGLHYVSGYDLLGQDGEGTVDGVHPTDVGFLQMARVIEPVLRSLLPVAVAG